MSVWTLCSCLAKPMETFIELRRLSGTDYYSQALMLGYFDRFLVEANLREPRLTRALTDRYEESLAPLAPRTRGNRASVVRQFCKYLARTDPLSYVPESLRSVSSRSAYQPYIYNRVEVQALLRAASELPPSGALRPHTYRTLVGLLYSTGLRIGEAMALNIEDFFPAEHRLYVAEGKFRKARWVALSESTCRALRQYLDRRLRKTPCTPEAPLLLNQRRQRLCYPTVHATFRSLLEQCGMLHRQRPGPRIHDMRHTFAVERLLGWYRDGIDVNARLPGLATHMGHVNVSSTRVYLRPTAELLGEVRDRFRNHYLQHIITNGEAS